jgi:L-asparaginase II
MASLKVNVYRGTTIESSHHLDYAVFHAQGDLLSQQGDIEQGIFPRSSIKMMQALDCFLSGAADHYKFSEKEITIACASHNAEPIHVDTVKAWLKRMDISEKLLACGPQPTMLRDDIKKLIEAHQNYTSIHNNCSGKHSAMLANCKFQGLDCDHYHEHEHKIQKDVLNRLEFLGNCSLRQAPWGIDGCGIPTVVMPLKSLALASAQMAGSKTRDEAINQASKKILHAVKDNPYLLAGKARFCTALIETTRGRILAKVGAEGVYTAFYPEKSLGLAIKVPDGALRAVEPALFGVLQKLNWLEKAEIESLKKYENFQIMNTQGKKVGFIQCEEI